MRWLTSWSALALVLASQLASVLSYTVPPGSPGFYHGNSSAAVTFDEYSLFLDNKRLFVFSGEVHPWRLPTGKAGWRDIFQKMKAAGWNAVSVYLHWGLSEGKQGELDFEYYRSHTDVYEVAKEVGLLVIVRPGPYINAETIGGGFPGWLTNNPAKARTNETGFTDAWMPFMTAVSKFVEPYQYPDGSVIAIQSENEFFESTPSDPGRSEYMQLIEDTYRANGLTKIPITHNDGGHTRGVYAPGHGLGEVDLYTWDNYPNGFDCSNPNKWTELYTQLDSDHQNIDPDLLWASGEFGGGAFDPWGGSSYDACYQLTNEQYANVFYKNNYAAETHYQNLYMTFGGTNWGNLAEPTVYTSYDYGAPIREDRTLSPKYYELKLQAGFLHASPDYLLATRVGNGTVGSGTAYSDNPRVYTTALSSSTGVHFYVVRHTSNSYLAPVSFSLRVNTTEGEITVPQHGGNITLDGRESQILVSEYPFGSHTLKYSTAEIFTHTTIDGVDYLVLYAQAGHSIEAVMSGSGSPQVVGSDTIKAESSNGSVIITGTPSGLSGVILDGAIVIIADKHAALSFWNIRLPSANNTPYDAAPDAPSVLLYGPYLVRNASITGNTLELFGDINATITLGVIAPSSVKSVSWNGKQVEVKGASVPGVFEATLEFAEEVTLPSLRDAEWYCADSLPEVQAGFDDSAWVTANKTSTQRPYQPLGGQYVVYADEYGFHQGNTIARGHFTGTNATGVQLSVQGGYNFGYSVWINSKFLGSSQGTNQYSAGGGVDMTNDTWTFDPADLTEGDNVLTVVVDQTGLEEDYDGDDTFKTPRGVRGYTLLGGTDFAYWKVQGNLGGEDFADKVRGPLNEGGLFVERQGAQLPGFPVDSTTGWNKSTSDASCTPYDGMTSAGIRAYRTSFNLNLPEGSDVPVALQFERTPSSSYRSVVYINGWQFGRFNSRDGPQTSFPLPEGILNPRGSNELLVTLWSLDGEGAKIADLQLNNTALLQSSKEVVPGGVVASPGYGELRS
ncbi:hypothetical protein GLOTRDRAFT_111095 [Gloeophyllum trabeum ATCC 11539]|uniref:beta-galactosidase n=1 Tax=Gloeophyllum trabeum (strain ATCC 11539 / FP-39264 / Madison 617) TaxID=670483 RepID=S7Q690_GLOTA|nr:uncharacterized protein GLOTRDRAFT_111095 [Gloeophyllum trabeum ATCC 11539]EPQ55007.1 hypothetical protein GLOTRDRAFT_111095 [Gloeophyllum trabeum ATCC 11539]